MRTEPLTSSILVDTYTILGRTVFIVLGQNQSRRPKRPPTPVLGRSPSNAVRTPRAHRTCACHTPNDQSWSRTRPGRQSELTAHTCAPCACHSVGRRRSFSWRLCPKTAPGGFFPPAGRSVRTKILLWRCTPPCVFAIFIENFAYYRKLKMVAINIANFR